MKRAIQSVAEIAAAVPRPLSMESIERTLAELRGQHSDLSVQDSTCAQAWTPQNSKDIAQMRRDVLRRRREVEEQIIVKRRELSAAKAEHVRALVVALGPRREFLLRNIERDYANLLAGWVELDLLDDAVWEAGGDRSKRINAGQLRALMSGLVQDAIRRHSNVIAHRAA